MESLFESRACPGGRPDGRWRYFQFRRMMKQRVDFFSVSIRALLKCSYSETNYLKYTRGLEEGLLYAGLGSKVRAMNSLNRTSTLWILNCIWRALSPRGECESGSRVLPCILYGTGCTCMYPRRDISHDTCTLRLKPYILVTSSILSVLFLSMVVMAPIATQH